MRSTRARAVIAASGAAVILVGANGVALAAGPHQAQPGAPGVGDPYYPDYGNGGYDVDHYDLDLKYQPRTDRLDGTATVRARTTQALSSFNLDFGLKVSAVKVNGRPARFTTSGAHELVITPAKPLRKGQKVTTVVTYGDIPSQAKVNGVSGWIRTPDGGVAANEPESAWWWYPSNDHPTDKATYAVKVTVPDGYRAISNGRPTGEHRRDGWTTYGWREKSPQASYLATLAVGRFDVVSKRAGKGFPAVYAYSPDLPAEVRRNAQESLEKTPEIVAWGSRVFGAYPFDSIGGYVPNVKTTYALETQTRPFYSPSFFAKGPNVSVVVHENAHQWFGNSVSTTSWRDIWLNEGFANYAEWLYAEQHGGLTAQQQVDAVYAQYPAGDPFWQVKPGDPGAANQFHRAVYRRGAIGVHALRLAVGDEAFFKVLRTWLAAKRGQDATIEEFVAHAEKVSGKRLDEVIETWLFTPGKPAAAPGH